GNIGMLPVIADFNDDGNPDLASWYPPVVVLTGNGNGTAHGGFAGAEIDLPFTSVHLLAADWNNDGRTDLAVSGTFRQTINGVSTTSAKTWILLGHGDGNFSVSDSYPFGAAINSGDFNGDGAIDLVLVDFSGNTSGILEGRGDGSFQHLTPLSAGVPLAVADFNADGRTDLLTANATTGVATLLVGAPLSGTAPAPPASITATSGIPQSAVTGTAFPQPLQATVRDAAGLPVSNTTVTFTAPSSNAGAILSADRVLTDASGIASVLATANN